MPLIRRIPKRGFRSPRRERMETVNVEQLNIFDEGTMVDPQALAARGLIRNRNIGVKILGGGELTKRLEVLADAFSASSRKKIEDAKGTAKVREAQSVKPETQSVKLEAQSVKLEA